MAKGPGSRSIVVRHPIARWLLFVIKGFSNIGSRRMRSMPSRHACVLVPAIISSGGTWCTGETCEAGDALFAFCRRPADTIRPRLEACGAHLLLAACRDPSLKQKEIARRPVTASRRYRASSARPDFQEVYDLLIREAAIRRRHVLFLGLGACPERRESQ
jgi:hypothetical protein